MKALFKTIIVRILTAEAAWLLRRKNPTIIAITGSVGKTGTKDAIYAAIKDTVSARKSQKSFNSEIGVPLTMLGLQNGWNNPLRWLWNVIDGAATALFARDYPAVLVLEAGVDSPGDMSALTSWLTPDVVVLTRLPDVPVHVEQFAAPEDVVKEKWVLVEALRDNGVLVYNHDDEIIRSRLSSVRQKTIGFGIEAPTDVMATRAAVYRTDGRPSGVTFGVRVDEAVHTVQLPDVIGSQVQYAITAAVGVAQYVGVNTEAALTGIRVLQTPPGRMRIIPGIKDTMLIDDSYNSSPVAVEHALDTLGELESGGRRIAVLGDMLELGPYSTAEHERLGALAARSCDCLLTVGVRARGFAAGALNAGLDEAAIFQYEHADRAGRELQTMLQPGDVVLIKGSQGIRTEKIVKEVMRYPRDAELQLVRQDPAWIDR